MSVRKLLTRDQFREGVFARDKHKCVFCSETADIVAHHIIERRLWDEPDQLGGYFLDNGASVCEAHHIDCETTALSVEAVREACGILKPILPSHLYDDEIYDKWGNIILANGQRLRGELFFDESVQKILSQGGFLDVFTNRVKYPRTNHVPWSAGMHDDDRMHRDMSYFVGKRAIVARKLDGENTTMYSDYIHARSIDGRHHVSRDWVKGFWGGISADIPQDWRICAENVYARHSIAYEALKTYVYGFSIWNERNVCLSWDDTLEWFALIGIEPVPVLYDGIYDEKIIQALYDEKRDYDAHEGYVIRVADSFSYAQFRKSVGKFVRRGHIQTTKHWMHGQPMVKNGLERPA